jgi:hypothetical protein
MCLASYWASAWRSWPREAVTSPSPLGRLVAGCFLQPLVVELALSGTPLLDELVQPVTPRGDTRDLTQELERALTGFAVVASVYVPGRV